MHSGMRRWHSRIDNNHGSNGRAHSPSLTTIETIGAEWGPLVAVRGTLRLLAGRSMAPSPRSNGQQLGAAFDPEAKCLPFTFRPETRPDPQSGHLALCLASTTGMLRHTLPLRISARIGSSI